MVARSDANRLEPAPATHRDVLDSRGRAPPAPETDWVALLRAVAARDQSALHALYDRAHGIVFTRVMRIARDRAIAEEITSDVFHEVWRRAPEWDASSGSVVGWIANIARSRAIDRVRFDRRKKRRESGVVDVIGSTEPAEREEKALRAALGRLTPEEREVIEHAYGEGLTHAEVAEALSLPLGTVKTRIRSGLEKLRAELSAVPAVRSGRVTAASASWPSPACGRGGA